MNIAKSIRDAISHKPTAHVPARKAKPILTTLEMLTTTAQAFADTVDSPMTPAKHIAMLTTVRDVNDEVWSQASSEDKCIIREAHRFASMTLKWLLKHRDIQTRDRTKHHGRYRPSTYTRLEVILMATTEKSSEAEAA